MNCWDRKRDLKDLLDNFLNRLFLKNAKVAFMGQKLQRRHQRDLVKAVAPVSAGSAELMNHAVNKPHAMRPPDGKHR